MRTSTFPRAGAQRPYAVWLFAAIATALLLAACSSGPVPIAYDQDSCDYCRMQISDPRYGAELITRTGKVHKFDSIECLASFYAGLQDSASVRSLWVSDYREPGTLIPVREAVFIHHAGPGSPMGRGLLALRAGAAAATGSVPAGDTVSWGNVVEMVGREGLAPGMAPTGTSDVHKGAADAHQH
jgi:copper chaperone NosL